MHAIRKKLIEVALPLDAINAASAREKSIRHGHPSTLHLWWARRPLAACRALLFGQLVDDPSAWPDLYPTEEVQDRERQRLFRLIEELVTWENSTNERVIGAARLEIARSIARGRKADGLADERDEAVLRIQPTATGASILPLKAQDAQAVNDYLAEVAPPVHDPFAGGGSIPLEAQRLGLRAIATDLNPVAVLINKALIEIPPKFAGMPPVNPEARAKAKQDLAPREWKGAQGLAEDVRYYGKWMRGEAFKRIGHLYPPVELPEEYGGGRATVVAWIWARTVECPNPACGVEAPLVKTFQLSAGTRGGRQAAYVVPEPTGTTGKITYHVKHGSTAPIAGTVKRNGARCLVCDSPISLDYIRESGQSGRVDAVPIAMVAQSSRQRLYLSCDEASQEAAKRAMSSPGAANIPTTDLPASALGFRVQRYGISTHAGIFSKRQLLALSTFGDLVQEAANVAGKASTSDYANGLAVYLAAAVDKAVNYWSSLCSWYVNKEIMVSTFGLPTLSMVWDYAEANPFSESSGNWMLGIEQAARALENLYYPTLTGRVFQADAASDIPSTVSPVVQCDPPYYDNIGYACLSDIFYVWLRRNLLPIYPDILSTILTPKKPELIADPGRFDGGRDESVRHFETGLKEVFGRLHDSSNNEFPLCMFYAFKQQEASKARGVPGSTVSSTGWERMLEGLVGRGFSIIGTWPVRTEQTGGLREAGRNSLASSIVLVCRKRPENAPTTDRTTFRRLLRTELPAALKNLQHGNIAPVDMAQASIGPGMAIFSRHARVLEPDGSPMTVRTALQFINQALDEYLAEQEGDFDGDTRFALTWFETHAFDAGPFGEAETLAKARNVSVQGVVEAGVLNSAAGKVRLLTRKELPADWDPATDKRLTVWEAAQHLIKRLDEQGEQAAAELLSRLRSRADAARDLAYRLYTTCERKKWAEEAGAYNRLVVAWPELEKLAAQVKTPSAPMQGALL
jgi:putative DNA methylase